VNWRLAQILTDALAECAYLSGDEAANVRTVVDPHAYVDLNPKAARRFGLTITLVSETRMRAGSKSGGHPLGTFPSPPSLIGT